MTMNTPIKWKDLADGTKVIVKDNIYKVKEDIQRLTVFSEYESHLIYEKFFEKDTLLIFDKDNCYLHTEDIEKSMKIDNLNDYIDTLSFTLAQVNRIFLFNVKDNILYFFDEESKEFEIFEKARWFYEEGIEFETFEKSGWRYSKANYFNFLIRDENNIDNFIKIRAKAIHDKERFFLNDEEFVCVNKVIMRKAKEFVCVNKVIMRKANVG